MAKLEADLQRLSAEINGLNTQVARESSTQRPTQRTTGGAEVVQYLEREQAAVNAQVVSYERLNALIAQRIQLEGEAAAASDRTATTVSRATVTPTAAGRSAATSLAAGESAQLDMLATASTGLRDRRPLLLKPPPSGSWEGPARYPAVGLAHVTTTPDTAGTVEAARAAEVAAQAEARQMQALAVAEAEAAARAEAFTAAQQASNSALIAATQVAIEYDDTLTKTGALSGAAIEAFAHGDLTFSEFQREVTETAGKFGLWTAAAGAVYGVLGAVDELKAGLVDTSSAVQGLTKYLPGLDRNQARNQIVEQGQQTATPLTNVGDTAQQFAKVFKNQGDVFTATHVALTAAKLDNISLAQSYQYLTAIIEQTGESANYLPQVFDQITAAQDRFGARMSQLLPAFAGSVGAVKQAGGDPNQLLALEALTIERTGRSGSQIATAYGRGASNFFPTAQSQGIIQRILGGVVDPSAGFTQALIEAIRGADTRGLNGPEQRQLSQAFFGKQFGSRFATLFSGAAAGPHSLDDALKVVAPGASTGLASEQLSKTMGQANNQLGLLKVNLQAIGAELGNSNITTPLGLMVHLLNDALGTVVDLQKAFGSLPGPLKDIASFGALGAGAVAAGRHFGIGPLMAGTDSGFLNGFAPIFSRSPKKELDHQTGEIMQRIRSDTQAEMASTSSRILSQQREMTLMQAMGVQPSEQQSADLMANEQKLRALGTLNSADSLATVEAQVRASLAPGVGGDIAEREASTSAETLGRAMSTSAVQVDEAATQMTAAMRTAAAEQEALVLEGSRAGGALSLASLGEAAGGVTTAFMSMLPTIMLAGAGLLEVTSAIHATNVRAQGDENAIAAAQTPAAVHAAYARLAGGAGGFNPLGVHIPWVSDALGRVHEEINGSTRTGYLTMEGRLRQLREAENQNQPIQSRISALTSPGPADGVGALPGQQPYVMTEQIEQAIQDLKKDTYYAAVHPQAYAQQMSALQARLQSQSLTQNGGNPFYLWEQASSDLTNKYEPLLEDYASAGKVLGTGPNSRFTTEQIAGYAEAISRFASNTADKQAWQALSSAQSALESDLQRQIQDITGAAQIAPGLNTQIADYAQAIAVIHGEMAKTRELFANRIAANPGRAGDLRAAERQVLGHEARNLATPMSVYISALTTQAQETASQNTQTGPLADMQRAETLLAGLHDTYLKALSANADGADLAQLATQINNQRLTVNQDQISYYQALYQSLSQLAQSQTADPVLQQQYAAQGATNTLNKLISLHDKDQAALNAIRATRSSAVLQGLAAQISQEQASSQASLSQENIGQSQPIQLRNAVTRAAEQLSYVLAIAKRGSISPQTITQAYNTLYQAQGALAQFENQNAQSYITATGQLAQAETFDPVKMANDALDAARKLLDFDRAHHDASATIQSDSAQVAAAFKSQMEARWQQSDATTQYLAATYQIAGAQEIERLKRLLATLKRSHASYQEIQSVASELYNLEYNNSSTFNLNTAQIHLPSTYEVKSAMSKSLHRGLENIAAGIREAAIGGIRDVELSVGLVKNAAKTGRHSHQASAARAALQGAKINVINNVVVNKSADAKKVFEALDDALKNSVAGVAQAAGMV